MYKMSQGQEGRTYVDSDEAVFATVLTGANGKQVRYSCSIMRGSVRAKDIEWSQLRLVIYKELLVRTNRPELCFCEEDLHTAKEGASGEMRCC